MSRAPVLEERLKETQEPLHESRTPAEPTRHPRSYTRSHACLLPKGRRRKIVQEILDELLTVEGKTTLRRFYPR